MRGTLESRLVERWDDPAGRGIGAFGLAALELPYALGLRLRGRMFDEGLLRSHRAPIPVISVGNLAVGGTGKTPLSAWLVRHLADWGLMPAVVLRGYGTDELQLHRSWNPDAAVHAGRDRHAAVAEAAAAGARCAVLDDGFQHRRLARDLDIVLLSVEHGLPGHLLPRGRFREPLAALGRAGAVVLTRKALPAEFPGKERGSGDGEVAAQAQEMEARVGQRFPELSVAHVHLVAGEWTGLDGRPAGPPGSDVLAVTGVADPRSFARLVREGIGRAPELLAFRDHHEYAPGDVAGIRRLAGNRTVVVTEKDAVKLHKYAEDLPTVRVLRLAVEGGRGASELLERLRRTVAGCLRPGAGSEGSRPKTGRHAGKEAW